MNEQYREIKESIDLIIVTSKLLGYDSELVDSQGSSGYICRTDTNRIVIRHFPDNKIRIYQNSARLVDRHDNLTQKEKLIELNNILNTL